MQGVTTSSAFGIASAQIPFFLLYATGADYYKQDIFNCSHLVAFTRFRLGLLVALYGF